MLDDYLNQICSIKRVIGTDNRGMPIYTEPIETPCRLQQKLTITINSDDESISADHICYLKDKVCVSDLINGKIIRTVNTWNSLDGEIMGFKVVM